MNELIQDVLVHVALYLELHELQSLFFTCKNWSTLASHDPLFRLLYIREKTKNLKRPENIAIFQNLISMFDQKKPKGLFWKTKVIRYQQEQNEIQYQRRINKLLEDLQNKRASVKTAFKEILKVVSGVSYKHVVKNNWKGYPTLLYAILATMEKRSDPKLCDDEREPLCNIIDKLMNKYGFKLNVLWKSRLLFHIIISLGDLELIKYFFPKYMNEVKQITNSKVNHKIEILYYAAQMGSSFEIVKYFSETEKDHLNDHFRGNYFINHVLRNNHSCEVLEYFLNRGVIVKNRWVIPTILEWKEDECLKALDLLIKHGVDVNERCPRRKTALHHLSRTESKKAVRLAETLIKYGAKIDAADELGTTPLSKAIWDTNLPLVKVLAKHGASIGKVQPPPIFSVVYGSFPWYNQCDIIDTLVSVGCDLNQKFNGKTILHTCVFEQNDPRLDVVQLLLKYGADPNIRDSDGRTILGHHLYLMKTQGQSGFKEVESVFKNINLKT